MKGKIVFISLLLATYIIGMLSGVMLGRVLMEKQFHSFQRRPPVQEQIFDRFSKRLHLTREQAVQVRALLDSNKKTIDGSRARFHTEMQRTIGAMDTGIRAVLTDEQKTLFDRIIKEGPFGKPPFRQGPDNKDFPPPDGDERPCHPAP